MEVATLVSLLAHLHAWPSPERANVRRAEQQLLGLLMHDKKRSIAKKCRFKSFFCVCIQGLFAWQGQIQAKIRLRRCQPLEMRVEILRNIFSLPLSFYSTLEKIELKTCLPAFCRACIIISSLFTRLIRHARDQKWGKRSAERDVTRRKAFFMCKQAKKNGLITGSCNNAILEPTVNVKLQH